MPDPWITWDERVKETGRPSRLAEELTDVEILNLIASERSGPRVVEKRILKDELLARLELSRRRAAEDQGPEQFREAPTDPGSGVVPAHSEPMRGTYGPGATSSVPSKADESKWR